MSSFFNEEKIESPADVNLFVEDLIEQMVRLLMAHTIAQM